MTNRKLNFLDILQYCCPDAYADIHGNDQYPYLHGKAYFHNTIYENSWKAAAPLSNR